MYQIWSTMTLYVKCATSHYGSSVVQVHLQSGAELGDNLHFLSLTYYLTIIFLLCTVTQSRNRLIGRSYFVTMITTFIPGDSWGPSECSEAAHHHVISLSQAGETEMRMGVGWISLWITNTFMCAYRAAVQLWLLVLQWKLNRIETKWFSKLFWHH